MSAEPNAGDSIRAAVDAWCEQAVPDDADLGAFTRAEVADWFFRYADSLDGGPRAEAAEPNAGDAIYDLLVDHPMWIDGEGYRLDYLPEREARIADFMAEVRQLLAAHDAALTERVRRETWSECVREARRMGGPKNMPWFLDALAARNPAREEGRPVTEQQSAESDALAPCTHAARWCPRCRVIPPASTQEASRG